MNSHTYQVMIKTQYHPAEAIYVQALTAAEAVSTARRKARLEGWFDIRNDGKVTYKATRDY